MELDAKQRKLTSMFFIVIVLSFGLVSFIFCTVAELHRNKKKDVTINGALCRLPESPSFGFGIGALVCLCAAQIVGNSIFISQLFSIKKIDGRSLKTPAISKALLFISWISFAVAVILLSGASSMNRKQSYGEGWFEGKCYVAKRGVFIGSAFLALLTTSSIIGSAITTVRQKQVDEGGKVHAQS